MHPKKRKITRNLKHTYITMKVHFTKVALLFLGLGLFLSACGNDASSEEEAEEAVMTTDEFIADANKLGYDEFMKKYPNDSEITLEGEVRAPATWDDKIDAKFGSSLNDLPVSATFTFADNGGSKESTKEKVKGGSVIRFTGKIDGAFFMDGKLGRVGILG